MDENLSRGYIRLGKPRTPHDFRFRNGANHISPPIDKYNAVYFALVLAGVGFLLPYNSFTIAVDYYKTHYSHTTIIFDISLVYIVMAFFAVLANNFLVETLSLNARITFGYIISCVTLLFVAIGEIWLGLGGSAAGYTINLIAVAVVALGCTVQQSSFYGYTSMLPSRYTQAVMAGESAAGFLVSLNRIITKGVLDNEKANTFIFFILSVVVVACCFFLHNIVNKSEFVQFYFSVCQESKKISLEPTEDIGLMDPGESQYGVLKLQSPENGEHYQSGQLSSLSFANPAYEPQATGPCYKVEDVMPPDSVRPGRWRGIQRGMRARWDVAKTIWPYMVTIGFAYFVTLCLYPGIVSEIVSCHFDTWMPVVIMAIFNASDLMGKILAAISYDWTRSSMLVVAGCRILLIPLLLLCAMPRGRPFISGEGYPMFFSMVLGLTNGLVGSIPMIQAPCKVAEEHRELAGNIMTLSYNVGLTAGSAAAYMLDSLLGPPLEKVCEGYVPLWPVTARPTVINTTLAIATTTTTTTVATLLATVANVTTEAFNVTAPPTLPTYMNMTTTLGLL